MVQKGQTYRVGYAVGMQYTVGMQYVLVQKGQLRKLRHKRSTHTVDLANMGGGGLLPLVQKGQTHTVGYAVGMQYAVGTQYVLVQKGQITQWI